MHQLDMKNSFKATAPPLIDARHTTKSYMIAYELLRALNHRNPESVVEIAFKNEKGLLKDLATWCEVTGNELLSSEQSDDEKDMRCLVQKTAVLENRRSSSGSGDSHVARSISVLIATADLEEVTMLLDKALAGAVMGMIVHMYFEGRGVFLLRRGYRVKVSGLIGRFMTPRLESSIIEKGGLLPGAAIEILQDLEAQFYVRGPAMEEFGIGEEEIVVRSCIVASTMTWVDLMARSDVNVV